MVLDAFLRINTVNRENVLKAEKHETHKTLIFYLSISRKISTSNTQNVTVMVVDGELAFQQQENVREAIRFRPNEEKTAVSIGAYIATNIFIPYGKNTRVVVYCISRFRLTVNTLVKVWTVL